MTVQATPATVILYVRDPLASAEFYRGLFGLAPVEASPGFAMFVLPSGLQLGLWKAADVRPATTVAPGASELTITVASRGEVDALLGAWRDRGLTVLQTPEAMDFGYTFTAQDPDGHRLRVFSPAENG